MNVKSVVNKILEGADVRKTLSEATSAAESLPIEKGANPKEEHDNLEAFCSDDDHADMVSDYIDKNSLIDFVKVYFPNTYKMLISCGLEASGTFYDNADGWSLDNMLGGGIIFDHKSLEGTDYLGQVLWVPDDGYLFAACCSVYDMGDSVFDWGDYMRRDFETYITDTNPKSKIQACISKCAENVKELDSEAE